MQKHRELTLSRLSAFKDELRSWVYPNTVPVALQVFAAPDRISYAEAIQGQYRSTQLGESFGPHWATHWFRLEYTIPLEWSEQEIHLLWDSSSEALVWEDGEPRQGLTGIEDDRGRPLRAAYRLTRQAQENQSGVLYIEMACNRLFGVRPQYTYTLRQAEIAAFDRDAWDLLWDFTIIADMAQHLPADTPRGGQALYAANQIVNILRKDDRNTWQMAAAIAASFFTPQPGEASHQISVIGHAHIDTAWLWPLAETRRKCARSFASTLRLMDDYPDYKFACSQAQQYAWIKETYPELYTQIKRRVQEGRFIPVGGTWVEPDCNIPSGESLVRQFLYGQRFFRQEFGITCGEFWNPDVFGYSAAMPQIMRGAGIQYFLTQKLSWNQFNSPPSHTFLWEGMDGSQVLTHFPPADTYTARADVAEVLRNVQNFKEHDRARESLMLYGYGDGGGGPTPEMLEQLCRMQEVDGLPRVVSRSPQEFFERCADDIKHPTTWVGELYLELHRGTYTSQAANKRDNRCSEITLHDAEFLAALAHAEGLAAYPQAELERLWKCTLTNQFHDILPGSSIHEVYLDSARDYTDILSNAQKLRDQALEDLFGQAGSENILAFNTTSIDRQEVVELPFDARAAQRSATGQPLALIDVPALGFSVHIPTNTPPDQSVRACAAMDGYLLENEFVRAYFSHGGQLVRLIDKRLGRDAIAPGNAAGQLANQFILYDDHPANWEAWDVDIFHLEKYDLVKPAYESAIIENGPLRAALHFKYQLSPLSSMEQVITLTCLSSRLEFITQVDWRENQRFLKVEFPLNVHATQATYEVQFGHLQRPTHFNTSWDMARFEVPTQRWADLSEPGFGVALLNDSKYGYACHRNVLRLSLLRSPKMPDPQADMGQHTFSYALLPHHGDLRQAGVIQEGYRFNYPLLLRLTDQPPQRHSYFQVSSPTVILDTLKKAEDSDDLVVRLYESHGSRGPIQLASPLPIQSAARCNLLEENPQPLPWKENRAGLYMGPFKVTTVKLSLENR